MNQMLLLEAERLDRLLHEVRLVQTLLHELHVAVVIAIDLITQVLEKWLLE